MLVLSRRKKEKLILVIPGSLTITGQPITATVQVVQVRGDTVKIGVEASREVEVDRLEVYQRKGGEAA